jgi:hypothetical protein
MNEKQPFHGSNMLPVRIRGVDEESFIGPED